ncbi:ribosome biosynthesis protein NOC4 NDAI_0B05800 [Naumovozyma dairenensis CBS 421]|uniref:CCAAT-binding factor domain-containing protein n=1 Tax=Naumovozyma dairenensis (strain ATCC 10597 / BCRC 20456 / CBS 421 / NBRC 0211 / NRRL Y-12639) TaxID=1071378 RepID=G0W752_NAUDC|nr:hypothetical protein NDAI_0B05800 [Naumovozyma dairenensis CBS 421]CCD23613.1 hypothetical protein NDAI_0B05800 [Naumovozyma dairenensis CBS 421]
MSLSMEDIKIVAKTISATTDKSNYNSIIKLIKELDIEDELQLEDDNVEKKYRFLVVSLFQIFKKLFSRGDLTLSNKSNEIKQFIQWCRKIYDSFKIKLLFIISSLTFETSLALDSLDLYMQLIELESIHFASKKGAPFFPNKTLKNLMIAMWRSNIQQELEINNSTGQSGNFILLEFLDKYYKPNADIQYYVQSEFNNILEQQEKETNSEEKNLLLHNGGKWLTLMNHDNHCSNENVDLEIYVSNPPQTIENESKFKSFMEKNWLHILNSQHLSLQQYKTILQILHKRLIPYFHSPTKLMDFLTDSYNLEDAGVIPILALNGLFELMKRYNLEYPNFYTKLYQLITPNLMHVKYRPRFFRLMDIFLSSSHLSAHLIASFIKKLSRFTLNASPSAIVSVIPFVYNLIRKHPTCMIMLHNPQFLSDPFQTEEEILNLKNLKTNYKDPFDITEINPELTHALDSSLWELATLMNHYHANVATLAKIFAQPFKKMSYNMEDFLDWGYDSLLNAESSRKLKVLPVLEFEKFDTLFNDNKDASDQDKNVYLEGIEW